MPTSHPTANELRARLSAAPTYGVAMGLDADLIAYYAAEADTGRRVGHGSLRAQLYESFSAMVRAESRSLVIDVGCGPGVDTALWQRDGFDVVGVDLAHANIAVLRSHGLVGVTGTLYELPFRAAAFDALWTMSTFVHVPDERVDAALAELVRAVKPGAPLGIGTWGGPDYEGHPEFGDLHPYRFFALRSHDRWRELLSHHGTLEQFATFDPVAEHGWQYQFAVLRARL